jgi:hypothetical protein
MPKVNIFPRHIQVSTIYVLKEQRVNHNNHYEHKINMLNFVKSNERDMNMHAKF